MAKHSESPESTSKAPDEITGLVVEGYKSICDEQEIEVRPLTILAGANSSGKSSMMQPLLLLKQTLEASYDPGPLLLNGPNVRFTAVEQFLCTVRGPSVPRHFSVGVRERRSGLVLASFRKGAKQPLELFETRLEPPTGEAQTLTLTMPSDAILRLAPVEVQKSLADLRDHLRKMTKDADERKIGQLEARCERVRCFLEARLELRPDLPGFRESVKRPRKKWASSESAAVWARL